MSRLTKIYPNGNVTIDAAQFGIDQNTLDSEIRNSKPIKAAVERLAELENAEEKQIPKKPDSIYKEDLPYSETIAIFGACPDCGYEVQCGMNYCSICGQALDWSDME